MILRPMIASGERWRHSRKSRTMLIADERHAGDDVVFNRLSPSSGRNYCMSKICMATAQLVSEKRMDDEIVSGVKKKTKNKRNSSSHAEEIEW